VAPPNVLAAAGRVFDVTAVFIGEAVEVLLLAFFVLASVDVWPEKLARAVRSPETRRTVETATAEIRTAVARYVFVTLLINVGQGIVVALVTWGLGLPSPLLWGLLTALLEFIPYFGGFVMVALLLLVGFAVGDGVLHALLAPLSYLAISTVQNNLVSPAAYGRGLSLNAAAILVAVIVWYVMWGVAGALLAVPILATIRVIGAHVARLAPVAVFLER
jgi:predicted PurR-regulated permease PerM